MTTLYGGARPDDFEDDDVLTAELFKQATGFWVVDDVPSDAEGNNGDVVFVLKEEELGADGGGSAPNATGGDEVKEVGGYRYHLFTNSGDLTVGSEGEYEILVIGAGGGGGRNHAGGGGGGAIEPASGYTTQTLTNRNYTVTIADGGAGSSNAGINGATPSATSFLGTSAVSAAGGGGGASPGITGSTGGSGGGGSNGASGGQTSGNNTNNGGGSSGPGLPNAAGGGGGATGVGGTGSGNAAGNGGQGKLLIDIDANLTSGNFSTFTGMTCVSSGGGGGIVGNTAGTGGTGAGNGSNTSLAPGGYAEAFGCGGGGGGNTGGADSHGGKGYQGLVIVRYAL